MINSLSEGYEYLYIGTSHGGIYRYSLFSNQYDFPITTAQGLGDNNITSVYFDHNTGIIWSSSPFSYLSKFFLPLAISGNIFNRAFI